jgi:protein-S-isoprenylcysteine O-methyltransferase Ste14
VLNLLAVQISAGIALAATVVGFGLGLARLRPEGRRPREAPAVPATGGFTALWVLATLVALFWPVAFFVVPRYAYRWPVFADFPDSWLVQLIGVVLGIAGGLLYSQSARALGSQMTPFIRLRRSDQLIESGPYRFVHHPVYTAVVLIALGQTLLFLSVPAAALTLVLACLAVYRAGLEERLLDDGFGPEYRLYATQTGRFLPRLRIFGSARSNRRTARAGPGRYRATTILPWAWPAMR